jgi:hypothetical protein
LPIDIDTSTVIPSYLYSNTFEGTSLNVQIYSTLFNIYIILDFGEFYRSHM